MTNCPECGSDVAENDAFCPFCGISITPIKVVNEEADESFASTIVIPENVEKRAESARDTVEDVDIEGSFAAEAVSEPIADEPTLPDTLEKVELDDVSSADTLEDAKIDFPIPQMESESGAVKAESPAADVEDVPTPKILESLKDPAGSLFTDATTSVRTDEDVSGASGEPEEKVLAMAADMTTAGAEDEIESSAAIADSGAAADVPALATDEASADASSLEEAAVDGEAKPEEEVDVEIAKPADHLEHADNFASQSMFDSVRIMEGKPARGPAKPTDEPKTPLYPVKSDDEATVATGSRVQAKEERPHTTPNIGLVDTAGRPTGKLKPLEEGTLLNGRYEIVRKIGGGGMGAVYLASDNNLGGVLRAVKEMVQSYIEESQQDKAVNDFKRESMILSTLDHPSIPTIYDYFFDEKESRFYLVMKYVSGGDLSTRLRSAPEGKVDEKTVAEWAIQIADVLDYLHNHPTTIVYRDLKPSNIMIDGNSGRVMLIDFGIARSIGQVEEKGVTAVGTMGYAPPELFSGNVEPRSDIYSLGSTMFHLLTGADPQSNPLLIFDFQKNPRPRQINPQLSDQIERILMRSVEYNAQARFGSAAEMRDCLEEHLENLRSGRVTYGVKEIPTSVSLENQAVFCGFCGQKIVATDLFCAFCGAKQPIAQQGVHSEIYAHAPATASLVIMGTSDLESPVYSLDKEETLIGRRDPMSNIFPEVDLSKYDPQTKISRRHARIRREGNSFLVEDLGSSNGTVVVPTISETLRLVPHKPHALSSGDQLKLGDTTLHFVIG